MCILRSNAPRCRCLRGGMWRVLLSLYCGGRRPTKVKENRVKSILWSRYSISGQFFRGPSLHTEMHSLIRSFYTPQLFMCQLGTVIGTSKKRASGISVDKQTNRTVCIFRHVLVFLSSQGVALSAKGWETFLYLLLFLTYFVSNFFSGE